MLYIPPAFRATDAQAFSLIQDFPLATLISQGNDCQVTHMPMYLSDDQTELIGHFAAVNPHATLPQAHPHLAIFTGANAYISAGWYRNQDQVPTWNYQVVHVTGELRRIEDPIEKLAIVDRLSEIFEAPFAVPWTTSKMSETKKNQMLAHITGCALRIEKIEAKFKLSQNKRTEKSSLLAGLALRPGTEAIITAMTQEQHS